MQAIQTVPLAVKLLFGAPVSAILIVFFFFRGERGRHAHLPILLSCAVVAGAAIAILGRVVGEHGWGVDVPAFTWMLTGDWGLSFGVRVDGLSSGILAMVAVVGGFIHLYASDYLKGEPGFWRFFLAFHLFFLAMIGLLLSNNFVQLYLFWELVGLCSYLLIGYYYEKKSARDAALQAFMTNRVGDFGLLLGILILFQQFPASGGRFMMVFQLLPSGEPHLLALVGLLLFWAASAKSAQFPLYFWLPDAMEGPTPVSALMHAATMVTAGIFLLARCWPLISIIGNLPELICAVGAFTAVYAALLAATRTDLKRILAYSTVSHLGIMAFGLGLGAFSASMFHLITHGFFKAVLFLCAGNIAHALHKSTATVDEVGGLVKKMPLTFCCFTVAALSLAGIWPFAGFYSKDAVLEAAMHHGGWRAAAGLAISFGSAFYIFRMLFLAFFGPRPKQAGAPHAHEAGPVLGVPIAALSVGALSVGWLGPRYSELLTSGWLIPQAPPMPLPEFDWGTFAAGTGMAVLGAAAAYFLTSVMPDWDWAWRERRPGLAAAFDSDLGWRAVVARVARWTRGLAGGVGRGFDEKIWDDLVIEGSADAARGAGEAASVASTGLLNDYLWWLVAGTATVVFMVLR